MNAAEEQQQRKMHITVTNPEKQGESVNAYISYRVNTETDRPGFSWGSFFVIRRFSDFELLRETLLERQPGVIVPALPEKNAVEKFRFTPEFIESRRRGLEKFINRVAHHPDLQSSPELKLFLEASEDTWALDTRAWREPKVLGKKSNNYFQMFRDMQQTLSSVVMGKERGESEVDEENERLRGDVEMLEKNYSDCSREAARIVKRKRELGNHIASFGVSMVMLGETEGGQLGAAMAELGRQSDYLSAKMFREADQLMMVLEDPLKDVVRSLHALKDVINERANSLKYHQQIEHELVSKRTKLEKLRIQQPPSRREKILEVEAEIEELLKKSEEASDKYTKLKEKMGHELVRFEKEKASNVRSLLAALVQAQVEISQDLSSSWKFLIPIVEAAKP